MEEGKKTNIDAEFLSALLLTDKKAFLKGLREIRNNELQGLEQKAYLYIKKHYSDYREQPDKLILLRKFPNLKFYKPRAALKFYIDEIHSRSEYEILTEHSSEIQTNLLDQNISKVKELFHKAMEKIAKVHIGSAMTLMGSFRERIGMYQEAKANKGIIGLQTNVAKLNKHIGGVQDEMFIVMGRRGVGKTFFVLIMLREFARQVSKGVAIVSNEMSVIKLGTRLDSIFSEISYSRYRKGLCTIEEEKRIATLPRMYKDLPPIHLISGVGKSAEEVGYELEALDIDAFFVDGLYLQNQGFPDPFNNTLSASRAYQKIIKTLEVPGILTTQATKEDETKYARAIEEDADMVCMMKQSPAMKADEVMEFDFTKIREEDSDFKFWLNWKFDDWDFSEMDYDIPDAESEQIFD